MNQKKTTGKKLITGLIFIAALFLAAAVLVFSNGESKYIISVALAGVVMLVAAYFFLSALFEEKEELWKNLYEEMQKETQDGDTYGQLKDYMESVDRTQKAVFSVMKRQEETTGEQMDRLEAAIERMAEQQREDHKALVKYNKENARQLAINERESLELAVQNIAKQMEKGKGRELEVLEAILEKGVSVAAEESEREVTEIGEPAREEFAIEEPETEEPVITEPVTGETVDFFADALGTSAGVDLSDPNATLSPEDIAKLFSAAGN